MELNKTIQDLKMEVETIKKTQGETTLEIETLGKKSGITDVSISNRIPEMEERISGAEDNIENNNTTVKENAKCKDSNLKHAGNLGHNERTKGSLLYISIIGIEESDDSQHKGPVNIFNKIIEKNFPNLKKEISINI